MLCGDLFMKNYLLKYIEDNFKSVKTLFFCLIVGLVVGIITYQFIDSGVRGELVNSIKSTLDISSKQGFEGINIIKNGVVSNLGICTLIYLIAITLIAPFCICILNLFKGFAIGIYIPSLFEVLGAGNGFIALLILVILPNIIYIPSFIYMCTNSINFHYTITDKSNLGNKMAIFIKESYKIVIGLSLMIFSVLIEQFASFGIIKLYIK